MGVALEERKHGRVAAGLLPASLVEVTVALSGAHTREGQAAVQAQLGVRQQVRRELAACLGLAIEGSRAVDVLHTSVAAGVCHMLLAVAFSADAPDEAALAALLRPGRRVHAGAQPRRQALDLHGGRRGRERARGVLRYERHARDQARRPSLRALLAARLRPR